MINELKSFTATAHDDRLDACHWLKVSVKFAWWVRPVMLIAIGAQHLVQKYGTKVSVTK